jgi:hypothetical protein
MLLNGIQLIVYLHIIPVFINFKIFGYASNFCLLWKYGHMIGFRIIFAV